MYKKIFFYLAILLFLSSSLIHIASAEIIVEDAIEYVSDSYFDDIMLVGFEKPGEVTLLKNPVNISAIAYNGRVELSWSSVSPSWNVKEYRIYINETDFSSVEGMIPTKSVTNTTASITGLTNGVTYYFAVTAVNVNNEERRHWFS